MNRLITFILLFFSIQMHAQKYIGKKGQIAFFSKAPIEDISAVNNNVSAVYDSNTGEIVFQLKITDFIFPKKLMQEHFNENYLESDIYPNSVFQGKIVDIQKDIKRKGDARVEGGLTIHGETNQIVVVGELIKKEDVVNISANFLIRLVDYNIEIPSIMMYKIAEEIAIKVNIELKEIK
ncbi:MAG: YceI family protein [Bacteroidota bacterium]|nr:YceI family protein [Bacteroidota bacterium]